LKKYLVLLSAIFLIVVSLYLILSFYLPQQGISFVENEQKYFYEKYNFSSVLGLSKKKKIIKKPVITKNIAKLNGVILKAVFLSGANSFISVEDKKEVKMISLNEKLKGYILTKIFDSSAIFKRNGKEYKISMQKQNKNSYTIEQSNTVKVDDYNFQVSKDKIRDYSQDFNQIWKDINIVPNNKSGKIEGFKVLRVKKDSSIAQIGIKKGDVIKAVNNRPLKSNADAFAVYKKINTLNSLKLTVLRDGQLKDIEYELY
jgi:general secretion pathway protein C